MGKPLTIGLYLILALMVGCSGSSDAPGDFSSLIKSLSDKKDPELVELLRPYTENVEIVGNFEEAFSRGLDELSSERFSKALETTGAAYQFFRNDLNPEELDDLLMVMGYAAGGIFEHTLKEAILKNIISNRIREGKPREELLFFLGDLSASYFLQGELEKSEKIYASVLQSGIDTDVIWGNFYFRVLVYGSHLTDNNKYDQAIKYFRYFISLLKGNPEFNGVINQAYSALLRVSLLASRDEIADQVATEMKTYLTDRLDPGIAQQLADYYLYREQIDDAHEILLRGWEDDRSRQTGANWTIVATIVRINVMRGNNELAQSWYDNHLSSVEMMDLVTEETCEAWMTAIRTGGAGLENPAMIKVHSDAFTWAEERTMKFSVRCMREYYKNLHYSDVRVGNYEDAKKNVYVTRNKLSRIVDVGISNADYYSWSNLIADMFFDLGMFEQMASFADQARQELLSRGAMNDALWMHVRTIISLVFLGEDDQARAIEREGRVVYRDFAKDNKHSASLLKMAAEATKDELDYEFFRSLENLFGYALLERSETLGIGSPWELEENVQAFLADGKTGQAIEELKSYIQSLEDFSPKKEKLAKYYRWLCDLLLFNSEIDQAIDAIDQAFLVANKPNNQFSIYRQDMPLRLWGDHQGVFLQHLRLSTTYPERFSDLDRSFLASQKFRENALVRRIKRRSARAQAELLASQGASKNVSVIREYEHLSYQIEEQLENSEGQTDSDRAALVGLMEKREALEDSVRKTHPSYFLSYFGQSPTVKEVQDLLKEREALILFVSPVGFDFERLGASAEASELMMKAKNNFSAEALDQYRQKTLLTSNGFVWLITKNYATLKRIPGDEDEIETNVNVVRKSIELDQSKFNSIKDLPRFSVESAAYLYKALFGPIEDQLENIDKLIVIPDGPLNKLPFEALITGNQQSLNADGGDYRGNSWLIQKYAIEVLPSVELFRMLRNNQGKEIFVEPFVGFGDPVLDVGERETSGDNSSDTKPVKYDLPAIPETREMLRQIAKFTGGSPDSVFVGPDATESNVKTLDLTQYQTMAFATHGLLAGELEGIDEPALALSHPEEETELDDGILHASEVATLNIASQLVLLTACNTGSGNELQVRTGLPSLASAFLYAGARSLIVSHWSAETTSAMKITDRLIEEMAADPRQGPARALQKVKKNFIDSNAEQWSSHPMFWAAFFVVSAN